MVQFLEQAELKEQVEDICSSYGLTLSFLKRYLLIRLRGFNNVDAARELKVHRATVQRYAATLQKLKESEFRSIQLYFFKELPGDGAAK